MLLMGPPSSPSSPSLVLWKSSQLFLVHECVYVVWHRLLRNFWERPFSPPLSLPLSLLVGASLHRARLDGRLDGQTGLWLITAVRQHFILQVEKGSCLALI